MLLALSWILGGCAPPLPPMQAVARPWPEVDELVLRSFREQRVMGAAVAVVLHGELVYARGYGVAGPGWPVQAERTLFRAGSLSKGLTGLGLIAAAEQGLVDLDADVAPLVPAWTPPRRLQRDGEAELPLEAPPEISLRQLMGHLSGITRMRETGRGGVPDREALRAHAGDTDFTWAFDYWQDEPLQALPGEAFIYSSFGVNLAGAALEAATGQDHYSWLREQVLAPLEVEPSGIVPNYWWRDIPERSASYSFRRGGIRTHDQLDYTSAALPGAGYLVTATAWAQLCGALASGRAPEGWVEALTRLPLDAEGEPGRVGMGVRVQTRKGGYEIFGHVAGLDGGSARWEANTELGACVVLLTNTRHADAPERVYELLDLVLP
ncbi:MAG: serine hydrolase [Alphaproteobacteria bacterium]|nr:serine hydrolase [Alphaproteobacteria bacterium]